MADARANFATSTVATAPSPATSGTSLVVASGEGSRFPTVPFNAVLAPATALADPSNAEIVRVTNRATDTLTITRTQESTSARTVVVGDRIYAGVTKKVLDDIDADMLVYFQASISKAFFSAKGELIGASANDTPVLISPGANDELPIYDSSQTAGIKKAKVADANVDSAAAIAESKLALYHNSGAPGIYAPAWIPSISSAAVTASRAYFMRIKPTRAMTITAVAFNVGTAAGSDDTADVGYYTYSGSTLTKVAAVGATTGKLNSTGIKTFTGLSWALTAGTVYYIGFAVGTVGTTAGQLTMSGASTTGIFDLMGTALGSTEACFKAATALSGSTVTSLSTGLAAAPILALRE